MERITRSAERLQQEVDDLIEQRRTVLSGLNKLQDERVLMEEGQRNTDKMISQLKRYDREVFTMARAMTSNCIHLMSGYFYI